MKKCMKCQKKYSDKLQYCLDCGEKLEKICEKCGAVVDENSTYCDKCGAKMNKPIPIKRIVFGSLCGIVFLTVIGITVLKYRENMQKENEVSRMSVVEAVKEEMPEEKSIIEEKIINEETSESGEESTVINETSESNEESTVINEKTGSDEKNTVINEKTGVMEETAEASVYADTAWTGYYEAHQEDPKTKEVKTIVRYMDLYIGAVDTDGNFSGVAIINIQDKKVGYKISGTISYDTGEIYIIRGECLEEDPQKLAEIRYTCTINDENIEGVVQGEDRKIELSRSEIGISDLKEAWAKVNK